MLFDFLDRLPIGYIAAYAILAFSSVVYTFFWIWGMVHAASTPKARTDQRIYWSLAMFINPSSAIWYWYVWKRWAFWVLFTPFLGVFISLPFVVRTLLTHGAKTLIANALYALGPTWLVVLLATLLIYPLILKLAAIFHLGHNADLNAMDRNDWVISLSLPIYGLGAGMAYCAKYRRPWAIATLVWWIAMAAITGSVGSNIGKALVPAGVEKREQQQNLTIGLNATSIPSTSSGNIRS
ncbi:hypothetical protein HZC53_03160 [Candidatus Uhrbacteria bacterium]|nr:hypothetical protein [Candidatus Uhrbacteria bacterium]